ncbi:carbohydrate ABC transporter permease [Paraoerskovia marina]|uniref:Carbohydrate ABC transporter membrane protein 2, CUT1 family n=1 Tax=Paraoerskovia marina TaxID=545619 RepID=A0A1H1P4U0_9CELL|nr:carbohydrate ABC transporter permease [Paraoerskovia marina]SDS06005.1 carbohydrate ABC transporter membrane protein 2, CUT1 family [Paraoerskovia marina]
MSQAVPTTPDIDAPEGSRGDDTKAPRRTRSDKAARRLTSKPASIIAICLAVLWTIPTFGLFVTSFRPPTEIRSSGWWTSFFSTDYTLDNYSDALFSGSTSFASYFINSIVITLPAVVMPITIALLAAYAFAWIDFKGRTFLFVAVFALQVVPIQVTLVPLLTQYVDWGIAGSFWPIWLSHTIFALPLAIFLLHNFMKDIPRELVEAARVDGAGHVKIFFVVLMPLLVPAIAAFGIFQFLWVWNDLLVALTFGSAKDVAPMTVRLAELSGSRGASWHLLPAGAFISMIVPVAVFLGLQRYFVRGLLAGSVKG